MLNVARGSGGVGSSVIGDDIHDKDVWYVTMPKGSRSDLVPKVYVSRYVG